MTGCNRGGGGKGIIDSQKAVGGWPQLKSQAAPPDTDCDGMPDAWESGHGLDPHDIADGPKDQDGDGYTNVEEYLNGTDPTVFVDYEKPENNVNTLLNKDHFVGFDGPAVRRRRAAKSRKKFSRQRLTLFAPGWMPSAAAGSGSSIHQFG